MAMLQMLSLLAAPPRFLFFTGKGGVGKTALSCAVAIALADRGKRVLLVSTDPASNLDEMLGVTLDGSPHPVPDVVRLDALNIDPDAAAEAYRQRVVAPYLGSASASEIASMREQLSGACTVEIAAFDAFAGLLAGSDGAEAYDHVVFDTAPTGHTLRLLSLPKAWSGFLEDNTRGASCLGPHSGLTMRKERFAAALRSLSDPGQAVIVLVTRPETSALREAARASQELRALDLTNQRLVVNGVFRATDHDDAIAAALEARGATALAAMPPTLAALPRDEVALKPFDMIGVHNLRGLLVEAAVYPSIPRAEAADLPSLRGLVDALEAGGRGLIMVMGKGGVGKTTIAAAIAVELAARGHDVHLTTTDPAAHVAGVVDGAVARLRIDRIDPKVETQAYIDKIVASRGRTLDDQGRLLLIEDLRSPCTEEVAVFHAFSRIVAEARAAFVVVDTAPTGHTLLLMDATGAYHRQVLHDAESSGARLVTPLMRLQDAAYTHIILVALPETTPVSEAAALQADLRRAKIEPFAWVINASLAKSETRDPVLAARIAAEHRQIARVVGGLAKRIAIVPWRPVPPIGTAALGQLLDSGVGASATTHAVGLSTPPPHG